MTIKGVNINIPKKFGMLFYNLEDHEAVNDMKHGIDIHNLKSFIDDIDEEFRGIIKYGSHEIFGEKFEDTDSPVTKQVMIIAKIIRNEIDKRFPID